MLKPVMNKNLDLLEANKIIKDLNKGELHVHLNGLISTEIIQSVIKEEAIVVPADFDISTGLNHLKRCESLIEYLKPWNILRLITTTRGNLNLLVNNAFQNLKDDNVKLVELRNSLFYIAKNNKITLTEALKWLIDDIEEWSVKFRIKAGLILTVTRGATAKEELSQLINAYQDLGCPETVIGLDIAGNENIEIDKSIGKILKFSKEKFGLGITIHAGETGNIQNIVDAVNIFHADRIGHGTAAGEDKKVMNMLKKQDICVEVCPISNMLTNAVKANARHPVDHFLKYNVPFILCSDNPGIHQKKLSDDYLSFYIENNNMEKLEEMYTLQQKYSFISTR
jgi:adenosine deaminase